MDHTCYGDVCHLDSDEALKGTVRKVKDDLHHFQCPDRVVIPHINSPPYPLVFRFGSTVRIVDSVFLWGLGLALEAVAEICHYSSHCWKNKATSRICIA